MAAHLCRTTRLSIPCTGDGIHPYTATYPECVACCMIFAISCVRTFVGGYSPYTFQYACALLRAFATSTRKSGPIPEYTIPMFGQMTETLSIIESSMSIEEDFFSVAITMPFEATAGGYELPQTCLGRRRGRTLDSEAGSAGRYGGESMFYLDELSARREDGEGVTGDQVRTRCQPSADKDYHITHLYAPPSAVAMWEDVCARRGAWWWGKQARCANRALDASWRAERASRSPHVVDCTCTCPFWYLRRASTSRPLVH